MDQLVSRLRQIEPGDLPSLLALNNAHSAELGLVDEGKLARLLAVSALALAIGPAGELEAVLLAFVQDAPPQGPNHAWFLARHQRFLYVDRVCVDPRARKRGLARELYAQVFAAARSRAAPVVCCEVNTDPPNPGSDAFHHALGFTEVGRAFLADRGKSVRYLERKVD